MTDLVELIEAVSNIARATRNDPDQAWLEEAAATIEALSERIAVLKGALRASDNCLQELLATVEGESPSLLDEDSGGSASLDMDIKEALLKSAVALGKCPSCRSPREWVPSENPPRPCKTPLEHTPQNSWHPDGRAKYDELVAKASLTPDLSQ